jgi:hypothetical protein
MEWLWMRMSLMMMLMTMTLIAVSRGGLVLVALLCPHSRSQMEFDRLSRSRNLTKILRKINGFLNSNFNGHFKFKF